MYRFSNLKKSPTKLTNTDYPLLLSWGRKRNKLGDIDKN